jgi:hypothetical protein
MLPVDVFEYELLFKNLNNYDIITHYTLRHEDEWNESVIKYKVCP